MIFMGEEWGASTPWRFTSHPEPELAEMVRAGRLEEFAQMEWETSDVPDPQDRGPSRYRGWTGRARPAQPRRVAGSDQAVDQHPSYPDFTDPRFDEGRALSNDDAGWLLLERGDMIMVVNFHDHPTEVNVGVKWIR